MVLQITSWHVCVCVCHWLQTVQCYLVNSCVDVMFVWILCKYGCIYVHVCGLGLTSPATLLFYCPIKGSMSVVNRALINTIIDDYYEALLGRHEEADLGLLCSQKLSFSSSRAIVEAYLEDWGLWTYLAITDNGDYNYND